VQVVRQPDTNTPTRRRFFIGAIYGIWGAITAALGAPALVYLLLPPKLRREDEWVDAGDIGRLTPNAPTEIVFRHNRVDGWRVISEKSTAWVVKRADKTVTAFGPQCTHLGCAYHWEEGKNEFLCPCHSSVFSVEGKVVSGPAPRPLDRYEVKVEGNHLMVGKLQQSQEPSA
jgi:quinol---cytochrome c reductase iron-sulfur subunit, bacillus type